MLMPGRYKDKLVAIAVDEAHCVCERGNDFYVAFARIRDLRTLLLSHVHMLALTSTGTHETLLVVSQFLSLKVVVFIYCSLSHLTKHYVQSETFIEIGGL